MISAHTSPHNGRMASKHTPQDQVRPQFGQPLAKTGAERYLRQYRGFQKDGLHRKAIHGRVTFRRGPFRGRVSAQTRPTRWTNRIASGARQTRVEREAKWVAGLLTSTYNHDGLVVRSPGRRERARVPVQRPVTRGFTPASRFSLTSSDLHQPSAADPAKRPVAPTNYRSTAVQLPAGLLRLAGAW